MRRALILTGLWVLGVTASVALAFSAVGMVASRVAPPGVARLTARGIQRELDTTVPKSGGTATTGKSGPTTTPSTTATRPTVSGPPTSVGSTTSSTPSTTAGTNVPPPTSAPHNTATTSQGGTIWTRCVSADRIAYVAALPKSEFERTRDDEGADGIEQWFESEHHRSKITAECSDGIVHAAVEEESKGEDD